MALKQSTIDDGARLKLEIQDLAKDILESKKIISSTDYDNLRNSHNSVYESFKNMYNSMHSFSDNDVTFMWMDIREEIKGIRFRLANAIGKAQARAKEKISPEAKRILEKKKQDIINKNKTYAISPGKMSGGIVAMLIGVPVLGWLLLGRK